MQGTAISLIPVALKRLVLTHLYRKYVLLMVCATQRLAHARALKDITVQLVTVVMWDTLFTVVSV